MSEELTGQAEGVDAEQATAGQEGGVASEPTAQGTPAIAEQKVDLTKLAEFRQWQAARDRRESQLRTELQDQGQQVEEMQREVARLKLVDADPEEVTAYYQAEMARMQEAQRIQAKQQAQQKSYVAQAETLLEELGLEPDTPGLEWAEIPSEEGLKLLARSAAKLLALQLKALAEGTDAVIVDAARAAKVQALETAGVAQVSTATGVAAPKDLQAEYEAEKAALVGTGDVGALTQLKTQYRKKGLEV